MVKFAVAAGAIVIATTSSPEKEERLKKLGASHVVNYKTTPEWGAAVRALTPNGEGVDHIVEVGGPNSVRQSLDAIKIGGIISMVGFLAGQGNNDQPGLLETLMKLCTVRGLVVGSRDQFLAMNRTIEANNIKPVLDSTEFKLDQLKESLEYLVSL
jgi:NADPH:quinone reductase-like Zn-dependent oxidoreductase